MMQHECLMSTNPAHNKHTRDGMVYALQKAQDDLWGMYDWPWLMIRRDVDVTASQRYIDPPADMTVRGVREISVRWGDEWVPMSYGIDDRHYAIVDSDKAETRTPIERWQVYEDRQIELWPMPAEASNSTTLEGRLRIRGKKTLARLIDEDDQCDLDPYDIVLFASTKYLKGEKAADIKEKWRVRHSDLEAAFSKRRTFNMFGLSGSGPLPDRSSRVIPRVHYRVNEV